MSVSSVYRVDTGEVVSLIFGGLPMPEEIPAGCDWVPGASETAIEYIHNRQIISRPAFPIIYNSSTVAPNQPFIIQNIPLNTHVFYPGGDLFIIDQNDSDFDIEFAEPGIYEIRLELWPYQEEIIYAKCEA